MGADSMPINYRDHSLDGERVFYINGQARSRGGLSHL